MTIGVDPVAFAIGSLAVRWSGILVVVGTGVGAATALRECMRQGLPTEPMLDALAWALPIGVVFGRLIDVLGWWDYYLTHSAEIWQLNLEQGISLWGAIVAGGLVAAARLRRTGRRRPRLLDAAVTGLLVGILIGRIGEFLDGHGQGVPSHLPWATQYSSPLAATPDYGVPRHPAQVYDALVCALLLSVLGRLGSLPAGARTAVFLVGYGGARIALGGVRLDPTFLFGAQVDQLLAAGCVVFGVWYAVRLSGRRSLRRLGPDVQRTDSLAA